MDNQQSLQPPANCSEQRNETESSPGDAMQEWLNDAQKSNDARDRIAVANGISRGVFGSLHLGHYADDQLEEFDELEFKRVA